MKRSKYNSKTAMQKANIIKEYEKEKTNLETLAKRHRIGISTLSGYIKNKDEILNNALNKGASKSYRQRNARYDALEKQVYEKFCQMRKHSLPALGKSLYFLPIHF